MSLIRSIQWFLLAALLLGAGCPAVHSSESTRSQEFLVEAIESGELADLVAIQGGLQQGIVRGMILTVFRNGRKIGELLVARSQKECSAALISHINPNESLVIGDRASPKVNPL